MIRKTLKRVFEFIYDKALEPPTEAEKEFLSSLKATFSQLEEVPTAGVLPSEEIWLRNINRLRELVLTGNPREFLRWDVVAQSMFVSSAPYISTELKYLKAKKEWKTRWLNAIKESSIGHPYPSIHHTASSGNLIHHAYHVAHFEEIAKIDVTEFDFVFEFGGGYGSMCRLFHNLGFRGKYLIFDLPHFSALQTYFLKTCGLNVFSLKDFKSATPGIICVSDMETLSEALAVSKTLCRKLFLATWSLSESTTALRKTVFDLLPEFGSFLIGYQDQFGEVNNREYFQQLREQFRVLKWQSVPIRHLPGNSYLIGSRPIKGSSGILVGNPGKREFR
jgi:hypothetical protein